MVIETVNVDNVRISEKEIQEKQKEEKKKDKSISVKIAKRPLNNPQPITSQKYDCTEWKVLPSVALVEGVSRATGKYMKDAELQERLRRRLLESQDVAYLLNQYSQNIEIENDTVKLILTFASHIMAEVLN